MTVTKVAVTHCDLCGYGGAWSQPEDFRRVAGFDFCRWCSMETPRAWIESGGHRVTFHQAGDVPWTCSCNMAYNGVVMWLRMRGATLAAMSAVPNLAIASATAHVNDPRVGY